MSETRTRKRLRFTRRSAAVVFALLMIAAPASASIIVQNYMQADITAAPPCFTKTSGLDADNSTLADFTSANTDTITVDGVNLLEEQVSITGMVGDRVIYTNMVHYENNCDEDITLQLTSTDVTGDWTGLAAEIWISEVATPAAIDPNLEVAPVDDWNDTPIVIAAGTTTATHTPASTGTVTVPSGGGEVVGAFVVSADVAFATPATPASVNWVAQATIDTTTP